MSSSLSSSPSTALRDLRIIEVLVGKPTHFLGLGLITPTKPTINRFADASLQADVDKVLSSLPKDRTVIELEVDGNKDGVRAIVAYKTKDGWSLAGGPYWLYGVDWGYHVRVRKEW